MRRYVVLVGDEDGPFDQTKKMLAESKVVPGEVWVPFAWEHVPARQARPSTAWRLLIEGESDASCG